MSQFICSKYCKWMLENHPHVISSLDPLLEYIPTMSTVWQLFWLIQNKWRAERNSRGLLDVTHLWSAQRFPACWAERWFITLARVCLCIKSSIRHNDLVILSIVRVPVSCLCAHTVYVLYPNHLFCVLSLSLSLFCVHVLSITALRIHNHTVLTTHNSSSVYTNDSTYTNISATVGEALLHVHCMLFLNIC